MIISLCELLLFYAHVVCLHFIFFLVLYVRCMLDVSAHFMILVCLLYAYCSSILVVCVCSLYACCMLVVCSLYAYCMLVVCSLYACSMLVVCSLYALQSAYVFLYFVPRSRWNLFNLHFRILINKLIL